MRYPCPICKEKTPHEFLEERGDYNELYFVECQSCRLKRTVERKSWLFYAAGFDDPKVNRKTYLTKYPRREPQTGEIVKSREHMYETAKRMGMTPIKDS